MEPFAPTAWVLPVKVGRFIPNDLGKQGSSLIYKTKSCWCWSKGRTLVESTGIPCVAQQFRHWDLVPSNSNVNMRRLQLGLPPVQTLWNRLGIFKDHRGISVPERKKKRMNGMVACGMVLTTDWAYKNLHKVDDEVAHGARRDQSPFSNGFLAWCFSTHLTNMLGETMWNHCNQWNWLYGMAKDNVANHPIFTHPAAILLMNKLLGSLNNELWYEVPSYLPMCRILSTCHFREL